MEKFSNCDIVINSEH